MGLICCEIRYLPAGAVADGWTEAGLRAVGPRPSGAALPRTPGSTRTDNPGLFWSLAFGVRARRPSTASAASTRGSTATAPRTPTSPSGPMPLGVPVLFSAGGQAFHQHHLACDPPLQHFADIVRNATRFRARHGLWPMDGWLDAFAARGLIGSDWRDDLTVLRQPGADEIAATRVPADRPF